VVERDDRSHDETLVYPPDPEQTLLLPREPPPEVPPEPSSSSSPFGTPLGKTIVLALACLVAGLWLGRQLFQKPSAPDLSGAPPRPAVSAAVQEPNVADSIDPSGAAEIDATDIGLVTRLVGDWIFDLGERGQIPVRLTNVAAGDSRIESSGFQLFSVESEALPRRFGAVKTTDRGVLLAFVNERQELGTLFEQVELHNADLFSFVEAASGHRRFAHRAGTLGNLPADDLSIGEAGAQDAETGEVADLRLPDLPPKEQKTTADKATLAKRREEIAQLFKRADDLEKRQKWTALLATLDRILELEADNRQAKRRRGEVETVLAEQAREARDQVRDRLEDLRNGIQNRDLETIRRLWGNRLPPSSSRYFTQLFRRYTKIQARISLISFNLENNGIAFDAMVRLEGREKTRRRETNFEEHVWRGELDDGIFVTPFP
jgi:hypothetical protein